MLLILMYHQIINPNVDVEISINKFQQHLKYLQQNFNIVVPGQPLFKDKISVCLTFDDAYADFYIYVFPILKALNIPVILAIPVGLVQDTTVVDDKTRLSSMYPDGLDPKEASKSPLCTWEEIKKMVATRLVYPASHSLTHANLTKIDSSEVFKEICASKRTIWLKLEEITEIMIYPFGAQNQHVHTMAKNHYKYLMRIGNASNVSWDQNFLYRIDADKLWKNNKSISKLKICLWYVNYLLNKFRGK